MSELKIEVTGGKPNIEIGGVPIGREVTRLVFTADSTRKDNAVELSLELNGVARFNFGADGATPSPYVVDLARVVHLTDMGCELGNLIRRAGQEVTAVEVTGE